MDERLLDEVSGLIVLEEARAGGGRLLAELQAGRRVGESLDIEARRLASGIALIELARERSQLARFTAPAKMVQLAEASCALADHLAIDPYGDRVVQDIRAQAWAELGNAYRVADDLESAERAMARAQALVANGAGEAVLARVMELLASLLSDLRRFSEAAELLDSLENLHARRGEAVHLARVLVKKGHVLTQANEPEHAILVILRALRTMEPQSPYRLAAVHSLALNLSESGFHDAAFQVIEKNRRLYRRAGKLNQIRLFWLEGKIAAGLGQAGPAEGKLQTARRAFLHVGKPGDAALVSLDLALLFARQERRSDVAFLAEQMLGTFQALGIGREAMASLALLRRSCEKQLSAERLCGQIELLARMLPELPFRTAGKKRIE